MCFPIFSSSVMVLSPHIATIVCRIANTHSLVPFTNIFIPRKYKPRPAGLTLKNFYCAEFIIPQSYFPATERTGKKSFYGISILHFSHLRPHCQHSASLFRKISRRSLYPPPNLSVTVSTRPSGNVTLDPNGK